MRITIDVYSAYSFSIWPSNIWSTLIEMVSSVGSDIFQAQKDPF